MAEAVVRLRVDASGATRALNGVQAQTNKLQSAFGGLRTALGGIGLTVLARNAIKTSTNFEKLNVRLGLLTKASGTFARSQQIAAEAQKAFGLSAIEALEGITDITARLQPLGVGVEDIKSTFFGFNTAAKLAGASTIEASNAFRQLAQALGSGRLAGDEFRSISEQIPTLLAPIADELDVNVGQLKKFAAEGKLTSEVVLRALRKIESAGGASLWALIENDPTQVFKNLSNETENLSRAFGEVLEPVVIPVIKGLTELTIAATNFVNSPIGKTAAIFSAIAVAAKGVAVLSPVVAAGLIKVAAAGGVLTIALNAIPFVAVATGIGAIVTQLIKQREEQNKVTDAIKRGEKAQLEALEADLGIKMAKQIAIINRSNDKRTIAAAERRLALLREQMKPIKERLDIVIQENAELEKANKLKQEALDKDKKLKEEADKLKEKYMEIGKSVEQGIVSNLTDAVMGTKTLAQAAISVLNNLKRKLIEVAIQRAVSGIGGKIGGFLGNLFVPKRANGGPVSPGGAYLVGERGPEILQMGSRGGNIIPNNAIGGGNTTNNMITVNVDASGTSVQGNGSEADQLGGLIASVVQATIIDEQRAGGLLNR